MDYDLIVVGSGPAGYVAAARAAQVGLKTALVEKGRTGGMCTHWGCVPVKVLMEDAKTYARVKDAERFGVMGVDPRLVSFSWAASCRRGAEISVKLAAGIDRLLDIHAVTRIAGEASVDSEHSVRVENRVITAKNLFISTGSRPERKPLPLPDDRYVEIDRLWAMDALPDYLVVAGNGPNALELVQAFHLVGKRVVLALSGERLNLFTDPYLEQDAADRLAKSGVRVIPDAVFQGCSEGRVRIGDEDVRADIVVNAHLRRAVLPASRIPLETEAGFLKVDQHLRVGAPSIFGIGDVNGLLPLAHSASAQGMHAVDAVQGVPGPMDFRFFPINIYSWPEMAQVGRTEPQLKAAGVQYTVSEYPLGANVKAVAEGDARGFVRLLVDRRYGEVLGVQIVSAHATDMISEGAAVMQMEGTVYDLVKIVHAHPTVSEVFMEAGFAALDRSMNG